MEWIVIDKKGGGIIVAVCIEKWFADAIVARYQDGFEVKSRPTRRAADTAPRCPNCGFPLLKDETRDRSYICSNSGACR